jgi:hypothetical protein
MKTNTIMTKFASCVLISAFTLVTPAVKNKHSVSHSPDPRVQQIAKAIYAVGCRDKVRGQNFAKMILVAAANKNLDPKIFVAIIMAESSFKSGAVNKKSHDFSIAQINKRIWSKEYKRLNHAQIDFKRIMIDDHYAITEMAEILSILALRFKDQKDWYLNYHSSDDAEKSIYRRTINKKFAMMASL